MSDDGKKLGDTAHAALREAAKVSPTARFVVVVMRDGLSAVATDASMPAAAAALHEAAVLLESAGG